jgi:hypothetical protein
MIPTISQGFVQGLGIVPANFGEVFELLIPGKGLKICCGCSAKFDRLFTKNTA